MVLDGDQRAELQGAVDGAGLSVVLLFSLRSGACRGQASHARPCWVRDDVACVLVVIDRRVDAIMLIRRSGHMLRLIALHLLCIVLLLSIATSQTAQELTSRYGEPDLERFAVRPGISLTVEYGSNRLACRMLIEKTRSPFGDPEETEYMRPEVVSEIIDELVPEFQRGAEVSQFMLNTGCNAATTTMYERFTISRSTHNCVPLKPERESRATIVRKDDACQNPSNKNRTTSQ